MTDDDYELWSPKKGEIYPEGYQFLYQGDWSAGIFTGRDVLKDITSGSYRRPKTKPTNQQTSQEELTMDKVYVTQRPQWSDLLDLSLIAHEIGNHINSLADQTDSGQVLIFTESLDRLIDLLREEANHVLFTDHKGDSDVE